MSHYHASVKEFAKMLKNLDAWIDKGVAHAKAKGIDPNLLLQSRLAPDQYPLVKQVQVACDTAKFAAARIAGKTAPKHADTEQTIDEIRARIRAVLDYVDGFQEKDFEGAATRPIEIPSLEGKVLTGADYFVEWAQPNFYFHVVTAYAILRHDGVDLGKRDFIGSVTMKDK